MRTIRRHRSVTGTELLLGRCNRLRMSRVRMLLVCLFGMLAMALTLGFYLSSNDTRDDDDSIHMHDNIQFRVPDLIRDKHIYSHLEFLSAGWSLEVDSFNSATPKGLITFSNLLAVLDPSAPRRLLLACHYDSKVMPPASKTPDGPLRRFLGASDAAVPCAMILELVTALDVHLKVLKQQKSQVTLQLVFFDGNEAFEQPSPSDSLYGSRYLAEQMSRTPHPPGAEHTTLLNALDLFVLLDLIGAPDPMFVNHFDNTVRWFDELIYAERRLHKLGLLSSHPREVSYFRKDINLGPVEDDHVPFLQQGVPVLHMITTPFPFFMHTLEDTAEHIHSQTIENLTKVLVVFLAEYIGL
ncbi:glutaminyl-peptide cyclotransferase-like protein isoform X2 [Oncorhynchus keta]|uniref:glutaminyl-peptide cyclotransferase-like protein isoform X2 n=1 Tax=Oncorhynchus keta TaxID=8018 RepID=UPI0015F99131|nr:glutaminyl-peptide cyclotransferase-like protein isoform X2 [Oncorhynchus keta]